MTSAQFKRLPHGVFEEQMVLTDGCSQTILANEFYYESICGYLTYPEIRGHARIS